MCTVKPSESGTPRRFQFERSDGTSRTFKVPIDTCQREAGIPELEHDVRFVKQGRQHSLELQHVSRKP